MLFMTNIIMDAENYKFFIMIEKFIFFRIDTMLSLANTYDRIGGKILWYYTSNYHILMLSGNQV